MRDNSTCHIKDLTGRKFGRLLVTKADGLYTSSGHIKAMWWWCRCRCGNKVSVRGNRLTCGLTKSCGCLQNERRQKGLRIGWKRHINRIGQKYGRLLVISKSNREPKTNGLYWNCLCDCGRTTVVASSNLGMGSVLSCGCLRKESTTKHGHCTGITDPIYWVWANMVQRCTNPNTPQWNNYGGATPPVHVCRRWRTFKSFLEDMGPRPAGTSLSRIADSGDYKPGNVVWGTKEHQAEQKRLKKRDSE